MPSGRWRRGALTAAEAAPSGAPRARAPCVRHAPPKSAACRRPGAGWPPRRSAMSSTCSRTLLFGAGGRTIVAWRG
eukprot:882410-Alexandrium_andersonii.AAC.1